MFNKKCLSIAALFAATLPGATHAVAVRDTINIAGSSTEYPFATTVAGQFGKATRFKTPRVESTGSGGGLKPFCAGIGVEHPETAKASRRIRKSGQALCAKSGIRGIIEVTVGYDGIVPGPPPTPGTRDAFVELTMEGGTKGFDDLKKRRGSKDEVETRSLMVGRGIPGSAFNKKGNKVFKAVAHGIREDVTSRAPKGAL